MFTLDIKKSITYYSLVAVLLIIVNYVYSLFSHNVSSVYMTYMFLYPLICGVFVNIIDILNKDKKGKGMFYIGKTIMNYGIATLVIKSFMKGVFDIAGTSSRYLMYYNFIGVILITIGSLALFYTLYINR